MNFYTLPLVINNRREVDIELNDATQDVEPRNYIVEVPNQTAFNLLHLSRNAALKTFVEGTSDVALSAVEVNASWQEDKLHIHLSTTQTTVHQEAPKEEERKKLTFEDFENYEAPKAQKQKVQVPKDSTESQTDLGPVNDHVALSLVATPHSISLKGRQTKPITQQLFDKNKITICLSYSDATSTYHNTIAIWLAHPSQFLGIALDFGSESSQMAIKRYSDDFTLQERKPQIEHLYRNILHYHESQKWFDEDETFDFYQEEKGTRFYKSLFFIRKQLSGTYNSIKGERFIKEVNQNLKMLVNTSSYRKLYEQQFLQLPNLKILHQHDDVIDELMFEINLPQGRGYPYMSEMKDKIYSSILKVMIQSFLQTEHIKYHNENKLVRMMLLVPNNYDTAQVANVQQQLNFILNELATQDFKGYLMAWEVLTISESDAAFIGYLNKENTQAATNKDYIIIDAGKGTTDFSVIQTGHPNRYNLTPVYRNGFAGAGNLITYSLFETLLQFIRIENGNTPKAKRYLSEKIIQTLKGDDLKRRNDFYVQLERLKQKFCDDTRKQEALKEWRNAKVGDISFAKLVENDAGIEVVTALLAQLDNSADFYEYVADTCNLIAEQVVAYLQIIKDHKIGFDCGGVILTGRAFLFKPLANKMRDELQQRLQVSNNQIVQLQGNELKEVCIKGVFNNNILFNAEKTGYPIQLVPKTMTSPKPQPPKKKFWNTKNIVARLFNDVSFLEEVDKIIALDNRLDFDRLQQATLLIGAKKYSVNGTYFFDIVPGRQYEVDIAFTKHGFYVRRKSNGVVEQLAGLHEKTEDRDKEKQLVIPSLLPLYVNENLLSSMQRDDLTDHTVKSTESTKPNNPLHF